MKTEDIIAAVQKKLGIQADGRAGPETWAAIYAQIMQPKNPAALPAASIETVDPRSEKNISTLQPEVQPLARALIEKAALNGIQIKIISGLRTFAEQDVSDLTKGNPDRLGASGPRNSRVLPDKVSVVNCESVLRFKDDPTGHQYYRLDETVKRDVLAVLSGKEPQDISTRKYQPDTRGYKLKYANERSGT